MDVVAEPRRQRRRALTRRALTWAVRLVLTVAVTWFILQRVGLDRDELVRAGRDVLGVARPGALTLASALLLAMYLWSGAVWGRIAGELGGRTLAAWDAVRIFMVANLGRYVPGKVWQIAGLAALARSRGVSATAATGAAVVAQGLSLASASLLASVALLGAAEAAGAWAVASALSVVTIVGVALTPPVFRRLTGAAFAVARMEPPRRPTPRRALAWLGWTFLNWVGYAAAFALLAAAYGAPVPPATAASAFAAAYVLGYLAFFAPAGAGVREGLLVAFLAPWTGPAQATALAVAARLWTTAVEVAPAAVFWALEWRRDTPGHEREGEDARDG